MVDDKDGSAPDPWAGIDDDAATPAADGFTFSFDSSSEVVEENPFADVGETPAEPAVPDPVPDAAADMVPGAVADMVADAPVPEPSPILPLDAAAGSELDADPFASLSVDAAGGEDEDISAWLEEPDAAAPSDPPLAVFPPPGVEPPQPEAPATDFLADGPDFGDVPAEDLHAFGEAPEPPAGASRVEIGTGKSGIVSPSDVDPLSDVAASSDIVAFGGIEDSGDVAPASGIVPVDDWADQVSADAALDTSLESFAVDEQPSFDASGFDGLSESGAAGVEGESPVGGGLEAMAAVGAAAAPVAAAAKAPVRKKGGGIGQLVGIVLGGLMAIPITYAILIWGFQRDPFKVTAMVPEQVAFLLPQKFQPGFKKSSGGPKLDAASALDDLATVTPEPQAAEPTSDPEPAGGKSETPATEQPLAADATPAAAPPMKEQPGAAEPAPAVPLPAPFEDLAAATKSPPVPAPPPPPPEPEPLDLSALESAVGEATAAFDELRAVDAEAPERRKLLVEWYKKLASVAEQCVLLEKVATDSGRTLEGATTCIDELCATLALEPAVQTDLAKLGGMWLASKKRPADGTVLLGTFEGSRQVGPYWSTKVTIDGSEPRTVAVVSRIEPRAQPGESVLVTGVVFDGDFVWATDCRPLAKKAARVEDLF